MLLFVDFDVIWRYFAWSNQILGTITLWAVTVYLTVNRKNYVIGLIPALFMTAVVTAYLFIAPETLALSATVSYALALALTAMCAFFFVRWKNRLTGKAVPPATDGSVTTR